MGKNEDLEGYTILDFPFELQLFDHLSRFFGRQDKMDGPSLDRFAVLGAEVVRKHPDFPHVICEMETYRGCYWRKCSFCIERIHGIPKMREPKWVLREIEALYKQGVRHFRLGRQTDFLTYMADLSFDVPKPNPEFMQNFHREIWKRCPKIKTLHLDNVNPKTIAIHPDESREIIKTIVLYQTPGNVAAMGLESADEKVVKLNNLASSPQDVLFAIGLINKYGKHVGYNGLPYFLPGINFVCGLKGETKETFEKNFNFLNDIYKRGLLLRRINIRQVKILKATPMERFGSKNIERHRRYFKSFKRRVRIQIDRAMLKRIVPIGRRITNLRCEISGKITFARQLATYPLLVGLIGEYERNTYVDARIIGYGMRSITAVETLSVNKAKLYQLKAIPGIEKAAAKIIANRPYRSIDEVKTILNNFDDIKEFLTV
jgi:radical SAM superfamily enzyme with C-terminal helix-hairpin-helix motif